MFSNSAKFSQVAQSMVEAQLAALTNFSHTAMEAGVNLVDLNVDAVKSALAAQTVASQQLFAAREPRDLMALASSHSQQSLERALAYTRQLTGIASGTHARLSRLAETGFADSKRKAGHLVDAAPVSSTEPMASFFKTAFDTAQAGYDQMARSGQQAARDFGDQLEMQADTVAPAHSNGAGQATQQ